jgi:nucleotide-binding universal stress UspA family protein
MTSPHPLGVLLALVFLTAMGLTFWWMFRVPPPLPREAARAYHSVAAIRKILVPVLGTLVSERAVELAARVGERQRAEIILAYVVHIPWTLPLNARLPQQEERAQDAIKTAELLAERHNLPVRAYIVRHRMPIAAILHLVRKENVDVIVIGVSPRQPALRGQLRRMVPQLLRHISCELIIDWLPPERLATPLRHHGRLVTPSRGKIEDELPGATAPSEQNLRVDNV